MLEILWHTRRDMDTDRSFGIYTDMSDIAWDYGNRHKQTLKNHPAGVNSHEKKEECSKILVITCVPSTSYLAKNACSR